MRRIKVFAAALAASMTLQGTALASPLDELNEILIKQQELQTDSLLGGTLGLAELGEAMGEHGVHVQTDAKLHWPEYDAEDETLSLYDSVQFGFQVNPELKRWLISTTIGSVLDLSLYGDQEQLALSLPQFYEGALALRSGNLKDQMLKFAESMGTTLEGVEEIPDVNMSFYPDDETGETSGWADGLNARLTEKITQIAETMQVEKTEADAVTTYTTTQDTALTMELYKIIFEEYLSLFEDSGLMPALEDQITQEQIDQLLAMCSAVYGDEIVLHYEVRDGLIEKIYWTVEFDAAKITEAAMDFQEALSETPGFADYEETPVTLAIADYEEAAADAEELLTESVEETVSSAGSAEDALPADGGEEDLSQSSDGSISSDENEAVPQIFQAYYEMTYVDPARPDKGISYFVKMEEIATGIAVDVQMKYLVETEGDTETTSLNLEVQADGKAVNSTELWRSTFDASTGELDAVLTIPSSYDDTNGPELRFDGAFTEIEKGRGFVLSVDELSVTEPRLKSVDEVQGKQKHWISGELQVSAEPAQFDAPEQRRMLLEMTQGELMSLFGEIMTNAEKWSAQFKSDAPDSYSDSDY